MNALTRDASKYAYPTQPRQELLHQLK